MALGAADAGWTCDIVPISDGGEGLLDCFGGANRITTVTGPLGEPVEAGWRLDGTSAVIEMATASGLDPRRRPQRPGRRHDEGDGRADRGSARRRRDAKCSSVSAGRPRPTAGWARSSDLAVREHRSTP